MPTRTWTDPNMKYKFGFNGQEKDNEIAGNGNLFTATHWEYDARLGRRWNLDPVFKEDESPYSCLGSNPILNMDPNGDDPITGILEAAGSFFLNVGTQVASNMILNGQSYAQASQNVDYVDATLDAAGTYLMSFFSSGAGTAAKIAKMAKSDVGQAVIEAVKTATSQIINDYNAGKFDDEDGDFDSDKLFDSDYLGGVLQQSMETAVKSVVMAKTAKAAPASPTNNVKANNAPKPKAQTNGGRPINSKGQVVGPSGKPVYHTVNKSTTKKTIDAARNDKANGAKGTPVKHNKDKKSPTHYHNGSGTTGKGKTTKGYGKNSGKVDNSVHYQQKGAKKK